VDRYPAGLLERAEAFIHRHTGFSRGDYMVITAGQPYPDEESQGTNLVKIYRK
jgi:pyruvate kinase